MHHLLLLHMQLLVTMEMWDQLERLPPDVQPDIPLPLWHTTEPIPQ
jgi:hypothetical protein